MEHSTTNRTLRTAIKYLIHSVLTFAILTAGYYMSQYLMKTKPKVRKRKFSREIFVKTVTAESGNYPITVSTMGTVTPSQRVEVFPQVGGKLVAISPTLVPGGFLKKETKLVQIDPSNEKRNVAEIKASLAIAKSRLLRAQKDYLLAKQRLEVDKKKASATLKSAKKQYKNAFGQSERQEQLFQKNLTSLEQYESAQTATIQKSSELENARLRLNELQVEETALKLKEQDIELAKGQISLETIQLQRAQQDLDYTTITAPFDAFVLIKHVGLGSMVTTSTRIATLVAVDYYWVEVTIPIDALSWLTIPTTDSQQGNNVKITLLSWPKGTFRTGEVRRLLPELDREGRMARVLIKIQDPLLLSSSKSTEKLPLLLGAFVRADITGKNLMNVIRISRDYLQPGQFVWVVHEGKLQKRHLNIVYREKNFVYVDQGIQAGEKIVISEIPGVAENMKVQEITNGK